MKFTKTLALLALSVLMLFSLSVTAFAANITVNDGVDGAEYAAYKLLDATDGGDGKFAYSFNSKYQAILQAATGKTAIADVVAYIDSLSGADLQSFANSVYTAIAADSTISADYTADDDVFENVDQGYYLVAETKTASAADTYSLALLKTAGEENITIDSKEDLPTVNKLIREYNDTTEATSVGKAADYDIGDSVDYFIMGTVSDKYEYYNSYYYSFVDTMEAGLTYNNDAFIYISNRFGSGVLDRIDVTDYFTITTTANGFTAEANLKEIPDVEIGASTYVIIEYSCTLNDGAAIGAVGNKNTVYLEYENNPFVEADGDADTLDKPSTPGKTVENTTIVFTFTAKVDKVDSDDNPLAGAGFTLYKWYGDIDNWVAVGEEITGVTTFSFKGLDSGEYKLVETTVPNGYNKCDDVIFKIDATYGESFTQLDVLDEEGNVISGNDNTAVFATDITSGTVSTKIVNLSGTELPSTGGIGTTVFYIIGGILVVVALVLLIAKIRMAKNN